MFMRGGIATVTMTKIMLVELAAPSLVHVPLKPIEKALRYVYGDTFCNYCVSRAPELYVYIVYMCSVRDLSNVRHLNPTR